MGLGLRIFLINDDDSIQRLPLVRYERLWRRDPEECLPEYASKRVRYAEEVMGSPMPTFNGLGYFHLFFSIPQSPTVLIFIGKVFHKISNQQFIAVAEQH